VKASARIVARAQADGATRLTTLAGEAPLLLRRTGPRGAESAARAATRPVAPLRPGSPPGPPPARVHLAGGSAGPLGGDELRCAVDLGPGARVEVRSSAASIALPGPKGRESSLEIQAHISAGGELTWRPEPMIAARGARHRTTTRIELAQDARLLWRDDLVLGRDGEDPGSAATRLRVRRGGRTLLDYEFALGPRHPGSLGPAVTGGHRAIGAVLIVDPAWEGGVPASLLSVEPLDGTGGAVAVMPLSGPAVLITAVAPDGLILNRLLDPHCI
jgi:urease accessory protein